MFEIGGIISFVVFLGALTLVTIYCLLQLHLAIIYLRNPVKRSKIVPISNWKSLPAVTIQLPIYNEKHVIERLIDCICKMDYPSEKLEIQILDDSDDETTSLAQKKVDLYLRQGIDIKVIRRKNREGFKAGALKYGLKMAKGELIAIFDADFLPPGSFLKETIPYFDLPKTGVVQTRWKHINQNYSLITILQAFQLDVHFSVEQGGRKAGNFFLQFNGTAGIWRKEAIESSGNWQADTLTEDLDLSYRAQMAGWEIMYIEGVESPAELPVNMIALKAQQHRWMKGGAENAVKNLPKIWHSGLSLGKKIHSSAHLLGSSVFPLVLILAISSFPALWYMNKIGFDSNKLIVFLPGILALAFVYVVAHCINRHIPNEIRLKNGLLLPILFPAFLSLSMGLALHNSKAVLEGWRGIRTPFLRTPKFNIISKSEKLWKTNYLPSKIPPTSYFEAGLALYFGLAIIYGLSTGNHALLVYHFLLMAGFGAISFYSFRHHLWTG